MQRANAIAPTGFRSFRPDGPSAASADHASQAWLEPDPSLLASERGDVPPLPLDVFSPDWSAWIADTAQGAGAPADYVALALLGSVSGLAGSGAIVQATPSWTEPLVLWLAAVGKPSTGKSPAFSVVRRLLATIEAELSASDEERLREHAQKTGTAKAVAEKWESEVKEAVKKGLPAPLRPAEAEVPEPYVPSQRVITDATIEAAADVLRGNPRGVVLWRDELTAFFANMSRYNGGSDQAQWLEAWPAAPLTVNRKNRPPLRLPRFSISILGGIQPDRLSEAFNKPDDGLPARFLYGWPQPAPHVPPSKRRTGAEAIALDRLRWIEATAGTVDAPLVIALDDAARELLDEFSAEHYTDAQLLDGLEGGFFGKGPGNVLRLAGALALLQASEAADPRPVITGDIFSRAAGLWSGYFWPHARAAFRIGGGSAQRRTERKTLLWIKAQARSVVRREEVRRDALGMALNAEQTDALMTRLAGAGWVRRVPSAHVPGRPVTAWEVNPLLLGAN